MVAVCSSRLYERPFMTQEVTRRLNDKQEALLDNLFDPQHKGDIKEVIFNGRGYGHGVGMCQMGARALASRGIAFDSILKIYYQGIELKHLY